ncbi:MAG: hypothetical protein AAFP90_18170, partial [Planctomycetota bacterium]
SEFVSADFVKQLTGFQHLELLNVLGCSDAQLKLLCNQPYLTELGFIVPEFELDPLIELARLPHLKRLQVQANGFIDPSLSRLASLKTLQELTVIAFGPNELDADALNVPQLRVIRWDGHVTNENKLSLQKLTRSPHNKTVIVNGETYAEKRSDSQD